MKIEFLGTGGAFTTPRAGCFAPYVKKRGKKASPTAAPAPASTFMT
ncbi:MAG: hypothetical protein M5U34_18795 [Chloroflexi bacterium]|nr:hypothetical protein [Chloroflexota bacterium]